VQKKKDCITQALKIQPFYLNDLKSQRRRRQAEEGVAPTLGINVGKSEIIRASNPSIKVGISSKNLFWGGRSLTQVGS